MQYGGSLLSMQVEALSDIPRRTITLIHRTPESILDSGLQKIRNYIKRKWKVHWAKSGIS